MNYVSRINHASEALKFIDFRLSFANYRGLESSQHNRYTVDDVHTILKLLNDYAPNQSLLRIRTTDTSKRPQNTQEEAQYAEFCHCAKKLTGIGTQDAMRKNLFVDWHRMGLINRYNKNKVLIAPYQKNVIYYVGLSDLGVRFISESNKLNYSFLFSKAINDLLDGFVENTLNLLTTTDINEIDFYEMMFFVSAINHPDYGVTVKECENLIRDYKALSRLQRKEMLNILKTKLVPSKYDGDKTIKRDFHNWKNKYQQIYILFNQIPFFNILENGMIKLKQIDITQESFSLANMKRSSSAKSDYFAKHQVQKTKGYELDHIIPLLQANTVEEFHYLDRWENLLYIDGKTHAIKTQSYSRYSVLKHGKYENQIILANFQDQCDFLLIENNKQGFYNPSLIKILFNHNQAFWNK